MRKGLAFVIVLMMLGCQGPSDGPGGGVIDFGENRSEIVECEWREDYLDPEVPRGRLIAAVDEFGRGVSVTEFYDGSRLVVQIIVPGNVPATCDNPEFSDASGAWVIDATCDLYEVHAEITECRFLARGET